jgi:hypothetical protein
VVCLLCVVVVTAADNLLAKKSNKHLLQDYEARRAAAVDFMALVRPALSITDGPLSDPQVGLLGVGGIERGWRAGGFWGAGWGVGMVHQEGCC